ncbi:MULTISPECIES: hypothetical protein [unclassified Bradyrhizobium]|uniref:hypothetical protein n=1 Tax=unclassified Bradyrhizobium TaxID=2631580 RepID=UPI0028EF4157|nr:MULTISPECIES: hypothetical protein [unclassified Bradyrhizobium]
MIIIGKGESTKGHSALDLVEAAGSLDLSDDLKIPIVPRIIRILGPDEVLGCHESLTLLRPTVVVDNGEHPVLRQDAARFTRKRGPSVKCLRHRGQAYGVWLDRQSLSGRDCDFESRRTRTCSYVGVGLGGLHGPVRQGINECTHRNSVTCADIETAMPDHYLRRQHRRRQRERQADKSFG